MVVWLILNEDQIMESEAFHVRLRRLRENKKFTMKEVAKRIGVPETTYREWEYGRMIQGQPYVAMASVFGVSLSELLAGKVTHSLEIHEALIQIETAVARLKVELQTLF